MLDSIVSQLLDDEAPSIASKEFWGHVGVSALTGAVSGGLAASGVGLVGQVAGNALLGAASSIADTTISDTGDASMGTYIFNAVQGAVIGSFAGLIGGKGTASRHVTNHFRRMLTSGKDNLTYYFSQITKQAVRDGVKAIPGIFRSTIPSITRTAMKCLG